MKKNLLLSIWLALLIIGVVKSQNQLTNSQIPENYFANVQGLSETNAITSNEVVNSQSFSINSNNQPNLLAVSDLIVNGTFETGDFTGWSLSALPVAGMCDGPDWTVFVSGGVSAVSPCNTTGNVVQEGNNAVYTGFDGSGPLAYTIEQTIVIPSGVNTADLAWLEAYLIDIFVLFQNLFS